MTGGGTGLGRSMAHRYLELGANVVICGRREDVLKQTAGELAKETGSEIETVGCDVRVPDAVEAVMDKIWSKAPLDILVRCRHEPSKRCSASCCMVRPTAPCRQGGAGSIRGCATAW